MTNQTTQNTSAETTSLFRAAALDYAAMGFKVFPVYEVCAERQDQGVGMRLSGP
jgi:hypothetical protein